MADPHVITGLRAKRDELAKHIDDLEYRLGKARTDLLYIEHALNIEHALRVVSEDDSVVSGFMRTARLFGRASCNASV